MNPNGSFYLTNKHSKQTNANTDNPPAAIFLPLHAVNTAITRPEANYCIVVSVLKLPVGISDGLWFMLVLLADVGFTVYHSFYRIREVIGNSARIRSGQVRDLLHRAFTSPRVQLSLLYYYYWYSALGPVWAETRVQSGDWYDSGTLHPGQVLRGSLQLLSPAF